MGNLRKLALPRDTAARGHVRKQEKVTPIVATIVTEATNAAAVALDWSRAIAMNVILIA